MALTWQRMEPPRPAGTASASRRRLRPGERRRARPAPCGLRLERGRARLRAARPGQAGQGGVALRRGLYTALKPPGETAPRGFGARWRVWSPHMGRSSGGRPPKGRSGDRFGPCSAWGCLQVVTGVVHPLHGTRCM